MRWSRSTPRGVGGVALVGLSGPGSDAWLEARFTPRSGRGLPPVGGLALGELRDGRGALLDEVLLLRRAPDAFELGCHGGPGVVAGVVGRLARAGAAQERDPEALGASAMGEDRILVEAAAALPRATTELGCKVLLHQLGGALGRAVDAVGAAAALDPQAARRRLESLRETARFGRALLVPPRVALVGVPNSGKSSLLNALLGRERVIVDAAAGTTRDAVEEVADLAGVPVRFVDTAGRRRAASGAVEAEGVALAERVAASADLRVVVRDAADASTLGPTAELFAACAEPRLLVLNKADLPEDPAGEQGLRLSAVEGTGLDGLVDALLVALVGSAEWERPVLFTRRQVGLVDGALRALQQGDPRRAARCLAAVRGVG